MASSAANALSSGDMLVMNNNHGTLGEPWFDDGDVILLLHDWLSRGIWLVIGKTGVPFHATLTKATYRRLRLNERFQDPAR